MASKLFHILQPILGDRVTRAQSDRDHHGRDPAHDAPQAPDVVAYPQTTDEVATIVRACAAAAAPIIPYGAGTSLERHTSAPHGGVAIDLSHMNAILEVNAEDMDVRVEAGVTREALNAHLRDQGLFFPLDPGANASLGGMASTRASGTTAVRYGTMRDVVKGLTVVTPSGTIIKTGGRARKSSAGYDLTALFVGAEGTLGVITELTLRLQPIPEEIAAAIVSFETLHDAASAVIAVLQTAIPMARIELLDALQMKAVNQYCKLTHAEKPTLFMEFHGGPRAVREQIETVEAIVDDFSADAFQWASKTEDRSALWAARHNAFWAAKALKTGAQVLTTDVCVPLSRLADCIVETQQDLEQSGLLAPIVSHAGDGNFHALILYTQADAEIAHLAHDRLVERALSMGGTCTGEHGVGAGKKLYLRAEHGDAVDAMSAVKAALDPKGLFNPGKIF